MNPSRIKGSICRLVISESHGKCYVGVSHPRGTTAAQVGGAKEVLSVLFQSMILGAPRSVSLHVRSSALKSNYALWAVLGSRLEELLHATLHKRGRDAPRFQR